MGRYACALTLSCVRPSSTACRRRLAALVSTSLPVSSQVQVPALIRFLGEYDIPPMSLEVDGTTVGGLSGIAYDAKRDVYYVISDDRGDSGSPRFYTVKLDIGLDGIHGVRFLGATTLDSDADTPGIQPYARNQSDTEEIVLLPDDTLAHLLRARRQQPALAATVCAGRFAAGRNHATGCVRASRPGVVCVLTWLRGCDLGARPERAVRDERGSARAGRAYRDAQRGHADRLVRFDLWRSGCCWKTGRVSDGEDLRDASSGRSGRRQWRFGAIWSRGVLPACDFWPWSARS